MGNLWLVAVPVAVLAIACVVTPRAMRFAGRKAAAGLRAVGRGLLIGLLGVVYFVLFVPYAAVTRSRGAPGKAGSYWIGRDAAVKLSRRART